MNPFEPRSADYMDARTAKAAICVHSEKFSFQFSY